MTASQKTKEEMIRRATLALRLVESAIPPGARGTMRNQVAPITWRKSRSGEWMLFGPAWMLQSRQGPVPVQKSDGTTEHRRVWWNSKPFLVGGVEYCYAKAEEKRPCRACGGMHLRDQVHGVYGRGLKAAWVRDEEDCSCGGALQKDVELENERASERDAEERKQCESEMEAALAELAHGEN